MNKDSRYALIALSVLMVVSAVFGGFVYLAQNQPIEASSVGIEDATNNSIPLKAGWNYFTNGAWSITEESKIIGINGSLMSIAEATQKGIINEIVKNDGKTILGKDFSRIEPNEKFAIYATDIALLPAVFIQNKF